MLGTPDARPPAWKWWVCGLLLLATVINYLDRQTLSQLKLRMERDFNSRGASLTNEQYGYLESGFGLAFAVGVFLHGVVADRVSLRWYYPAVLTGWSLAGFLTGWATNYHHLLACRVLLGFFEAGQWPCALKTAQRILPPRDRTLGNGILQSGVALGAVLTPQIFKYLVRTDAAWPLPFQLIGLCGLVWVIPWVWLVRAADLQAPPAPVDRPAREVPGMAVSVFTRRYLALAFMVVAINTTWHFFRAWMPLYLVRSRGYGEDAMADIVTLYYLAADLGSLLVGLAVKGLVARGWSVHGARVATFTAGAALAALTTVAADLPQGPLLVVLLMIIGFGTLGVFPNYYAFTQDLTARWQGTVSGSLGSFYWASAALFHPLIGHHVDATGSYREPIFWVGLAPAAALLVLLALWGRAEEGRDDGTVPIPGAPGTSAPGGGAPAGASSGD